MNISVIIPVYNAEKYLSEAVDSVLAQVAGVGEIILVDDGSSDDSLRVARSFGARVIVCTQENCGAGAARNRGLEQASGEFLAFLDADDVWLPAKTALQLDAFRLDPALDMVFGHVDQFLSPDLSDEQRQSIRVQEYRVPGMHVGAMLIRAAAMRKVGAFRTDIDLGEFIDWHARAADLGMRSAMLPDVVMRRRLHMASLGTRKRDSRQDYVRVLKAALDRRRKSSEPG